jgi:WD40 repeat protein
VISPDAVASREALKEVEYAASLNKRFAPIVCRRAEDSATPAALRRLNFIFFDDAAQFEASADQLAEALRTDIEWIRRHTEFGEFAQRWEAAGRPGPGGLMLRPPLLTDAEAWLGLRPRGAPEPPETVRAFIAVSREAFDQERAATAMSQVNLLAHVGDAERLRGNLDTALRLCVHAARRDLEAQHRTAGSSRVTAALVSAVFQSNLRQLALRGHEGSVNFAAYSPDGKRIVTASDDNTARIWDVSTGKEIKVMRSRNGPVRSAAFSPDGLRIATAASGDQSAPVSGAVHVWDAVAGKEIVCVWVGAMYGPGAMSAAFSPDGMSIVTASHNGTARISEALTGKEIVEVWKGHRKWEFRPTNPFEEEKLDDLTGGRFHLEGDRQHEVNSAAFSPDGLQIVTAGWDQTARIWDAATGEAITVLRGHEGSVNFAAFSPDGKRIVTASDDNTARIWDVSTGKEIKVLRGHENALISAAFSPDGARIVTASDDKTARVWHCATANETTVLRGHEGAVNSAAFSPDGKRIVTASDDKTARIWETVSVGPVLLNVEPLNAAMSGIWSFSPDGSRVVTRDGRKASIRDVTAGKEIAVLGDASSRAELIQRAAFSPDGTRIVTSDNYEACIWDGATAKEIAILHGKNVRSAAFSPDGARIVTVGADTASIWDAATGKELAGLGGHEDWLKAAAFSPDGARIVTASDDKTARVWHCATANEITVLRGHEGAVNSAAFSPDGKRIVTASDDKTARIWNAATGKEITVLRGHLEPLNSAAFSPDGSCIVTASDDKTARIWHSATAKEIAVLRGHENVVFSAAFSPDGKHIVTATEDVQGDTARITGRYNRARIWNARFLTMSTKELLMEVCTWRLRGLTTLSRDEMRLAGYPDNTPEIDVCAGVE